MSLQGWNEEKSVWTCAQETNEKVEEDLRNPDRNYKKWLITLNLIKDMFLMDLKDPCSQLQIVGILRPCFVVIEVVVYFVFIDLLT